jgi:2-oxoglutarate ferredoxin oxidoreductase subunit delta
MSRIVIDEDRCKGCGLCTLVCPSDLVRISDRFNAKGYRPAELVDPDDACTGCANCATMCPDVAIVVYRTRTRQRRGDKTRVRIPESKVLSVK